MKFTEVLLPGAYILVPAVTSLINLEIKKVVSLPFFQFYKHLEVPILIKSNTV